jgi:hypothetical protein
VTSTYCGWQVPCTMASLRPPYGITRFSSYLIEKFEPKTPQLLLNHHRHYRTQLTCSLVRKTLKTESSGSSETFVTPLQKTQISLQFPLPLLRTVAHVNIPHVTLVRLLPPNPFPHRSWSPPTTILTFTG